MEIILYSYDNDAVHLTFDSGERIVVPAILEYQRYFSKGAKLTEEEFLALKESAEKYACTRRAVWYLGRGPKSEARLIMYLKKKKYSPQAIDGALEYLRSHGYIDDEDYARRFVLDLAKRKKVGTSRMKAELMAKGVSRDVVKKGMAAAGFVESPDDAYAAAVKKIGTSGKGSKEKLWRFLRYRGFSDDTVRKTLKALEKNGMLEKQDDKASDD
ncbi:MAG TPA: RecX family transcriptional regulator [Spirochaetota bacterium]